MYTTFLQPFVSNEKSHLTSTNEGPKPEVSRI